MTYLGTQAGRPNTILNLNENQGGVFDDLFKLTMNPPINILILMESHQENEILFVTDWQWRGRGGGRGGGNVVPSFISERCVIGRIPLKLPESRSRAEIENAIQYLAVDKLIKHWHTLEI